MAGKELNKIGAAVLVAIVIALGSGFLSKQMVKPKILDHAAFNIEAMAQEAPVAASSAAATPAVADAPKKAGAEPVLAMLAAADIAKGEKVAKACMACHSFKKDGPNGVGPNLWGVVGAPKEHAQGFKYSGALAKSSGGSTWSLSELNKYLYKPKDYAPGNKMAFAGLKKVEDRAALLAWLRTQSDAPVAMPSQADIDAEAAQ